MRSLIFCRINLRLCNKIVRCLHPSTGCDFVWLSLLGRTTAIEASWMTLHWITIVKSRRVVRKTVGDVAGDSVCVLLAREGQQFMYSRERFIDQQAHSHPTWSIWTWQLRKMVTVGILKKRFIVKELKSTRRGDPKERKTHSMVPT
jgi:hypothetical protein